MIKRLTLSILSILLIIIIVGSGCAVQDMGVPIDDSNKPIVTSQTYLQSIAEGNIPGHYNWSCYGYNPNVGTTPEAAWHYSSTYTFPSSPMQMEVVSSSANDDVGNIGATAVKMYYLDSSYNAHEEVINLNGLTPVLTVATDIYRVNGFLVYSAGTAHKTQGNIILRAAGGGTVYDYILAGYNNAKTAVFTVPAGYALYITSLNLSSAEAAKGVVFTLDSNYIPEADVFPLDFYLNWVEIALYNSSIDVVKQIPGRFPEMCDIIVQCESGQAGSLASVGLHGWIEEEGAH